MTPTIHGPINHLIRDPIRLLLSLPFLSYTCAISVAIILPYKSKAVAVTMPLQLEEGTQGANSNNFIFKTLLMPQSDTFLGEFWRFLEKPSLRITKLWTFSASMDT